MQSSAPEDKAIQEIKKIRHVDERAAIDKLKFQGNLLDLVRLCLSKNKSLTQNLLKLTVSDEFQNDIKDNFAYPRFIESVLIELMKLPAEKLTAISNANSAGFGNLIYETLKDQLAPEVKTIFNELDSIHEEFVQILKAVESLNVTLKHEIAMPKLEQGPLPKNQATRLIEKFYHEIKNSVAKIDVRARNEIFVISPDQEVNLSYLILDANLTQLNLELPRNQEGLVLEEMKAISDFSADDFKNINDFLRTGKVSSKLEVAKKTFLDACLIANSLNHSTKLDSVIYQKFKLAEEKYAQEYKLNPERKDFLKILNYAKEKDLMTLEETNRYIESNIIGSFRGTNFNDEGMRISQGFASYSKSRVVKHDTTYFVWSESHNATNIRNLCYQDLEAEALLQTDQQNFFFNNGVINIAIPINTPQLTKQLNYSVLRAAQVAYDGYLKFHFKEANLCGFDLKLGDIERPNHGLAHTLRTMVFADGAIEYFKRYAIDDKFKKFCSQIDTELLNKIKICLAFYVTGRESEVSWRDNLEAVNRYKIKAAENFRTYVNTLHNWTEEEKLCFEKLMGPKSAIQEKSYPNQGWLNDILSLAHNLDLPRCYNAEDMLGSIGMFSPQAKHITVNTKESNTMWGLLQKWAIDTIKITGDRLTCQFNDNNRFEDVKVKQDYDKFALASQDPLACLTMISSAPKPYLHKEDFIKGVLLSYVKTFYFTLLKEDLAAQNFLTNLMAKAVSLEAPEFRQLLEENSTKLNVNKDIIAALIMLNAFLKQSPDFYDFHLADPVRTEIKNELHVNLVPIITEKIKSLILNESFSELKTEDLNVKNTSDKNLKKLKESFPFISNLKKTNTTNNIFPTPAIVKQVKPSKPLKAEMKSDITDLLFTSLENSIKFESVQISHFKQKHMTNYAPNFQEAVEEIQFLGLLYESVSARLTETNSMRTVLLQDTTIYQSSLDETNKLLNKARLLEALNKQTQQNHKELLNLLNQLDEKIKLFQNPNKKI